MCLIVIECGDVLLVEARGRVIYMDQTVLRHCGGAHVAGSFHGL